MRKVLLKRTFQLILIHCFKIVFKAHRLVDYTKTKNKSNQNERLGKELCSYNIMLEKKDLSYDITLKVVLYDVSNTCINIHVTL